MGSYYCEVDAEPLERYHHGGYHPTHLGDLLSERHYWTEGWVHLILSAKILSDHRTSENGGSVHFSLEAGSIFTF
jgi:hypothetical protein